MTNCITLLFGKSGIIRCGSHRELIEHQDTSRDTPLRISYSHRTYYSVSCWFRRWAATVHARSQAQRASLGLLRSKDNHVAATLYSRLSELRLARLYQAKSSSGQPCRPD